MKNLSYKQRLALIVHSSVPCVEYRTSFPHGFEAYVKCAAKCMNRKLKHDWG